MRSLWPEMEARNIRAYGVQATVHVNNIITVARHNFFSDCRQELVVSIEPESKLNLYHQSLLQEICPRHVPHLESKLLDATSGMRLK